MANALFPALLPSEPLWGPASSAALRDFLSNPSGQHTLRRLLYQRPEVSERKDPEVRRIQSDERAGYEACIRDLLQLAEPEAISSADVAAQNTQ